MVFRARIKPAIRNDQHQPSLLATLRLDGAILAGVFGIVAKLWYAFIEV